jgi:hypothetical protein
MRHLKFSRNNGHQHECVKLCKVGFGRDEEWKKDGRREHRPRRREREARELPVDGEEVAARDGGLDARQQLLEIAVRDLHAHRFFASTVSSSGMKSPETALSCELDLSLPLCFCLSVVRTGLPSSSRESRAWLLATENWAARMKPRLLRSFAFPLCRWMRFVHSTSASTPISSN